MAFLDVNPNAKGHTLCIPKQEINKIFDMDEDLYLGLMKFSRKVAKAVEKTVECKRIGVAVIGTRSATHTRSFNSATRYGRYAFSKKSVTLTKEEFEQLASRY